MMSRLLLPNSESEKESTHISLGRALHGFDHHSTYTTASSWRHRAPRDVEGDAVEAERGEEKVYE